jgi:hypothetical protein
MTLKKVQVPPQHADEFINYIINQQREICNNSSESKSLISIPSLGNLDQVLPSSNLRTLLLEVEDRLR